MTLDTLKKVERILAVYQAGKFGQRLPENSQPKKNVIFSAIIFI